MHLPSLRNRLPGRATRRCAAYVVVATLAMSCLAPQAQAADAGGLAKLLTDAMRARIVVSVDKSGKTIPAAHCRHAPGGCDQRLSVFAHYLVTAAQNYSIDPWLMAAMAFKESGFNPFALGSVGELGILQINPGRKDASQVRFIRDEWYRRKCRRQPGACQQEVVTHAAQVLARSLEKCGGDVKEALGAYNTGRCGGNDRYANRILAERAELQRAAGLAPSADRS